MSETNIHFLGEKDYLPAMDTENRVWRERHVFNGRFTTRDGLRLNYYFAPHPEPKAVIIMLHGYCGFWGKFHEYAWYLWQAGYSVYFLEQRGHGYSEGKLPRFDFDVIHVDSYFTYTEDLREFMDEVVVPASGNLPCLLLAHSMGGAVGALFLGTATGYFDGAVLTSPMLKLHLGGMPERRIKAIKAYMHLTRSQKKLCFGQHHFIPEPAFSRSSTLSKARYLYIFGQRIADSHYRTSGASFGWVMASIEVRDLILKYACKIRIPVTLMQAGVDNLVAPEGFDDLMAQVPQAKKILYKNSRHEIYNAGTKVRKQYYRDVLEQFAEMAAVTQG